MDSHVDLGFVEEVEPWKLFSHFFPSKVGGKPAWLGLENLPTGDRIECGNCGKPCIFLLQLYAPVEDLPSAFHRTLFVFICKERECCKPNCNKNLIIFRSQLGKQNKFYSASPPKEECFRVDSTDYPRASDYQALCAVCGCPGSWKCGKCKQAGYCSKIHQTAHWKAGHKANCGKDSLDSSCSIGILFKEFGLQIEAEEVEEDAHDVTDDDDDNDDDDAEQTEDHCAVGDISADKSPLSTKDLAAMAKHMTKGDKVFWNFKNTIKRDPEQVIRYERGGKPLWIAETDQPETVPKCEMCNSSRQFEFQIMPTLLNHLDIDELGDSIDWGTIAIYTCPNSCEGGANYGKEFAWKQDLTENLEN